MPLMMANDGSFKAGTLGISAGCCGKTSFGTSDLAEDFHLESRAAMQTQILRSTFEIPLKPKAATVC